MITIFPMSQIIKWAVKIYGVIAAVIVACIWMWADSPSIYMSVSYVLGVCTFLSFVLLIVAEKLWRKLWNVFPNLNSKAFPIIDGDWIMDIDYQIHDDLTGKIQSRKTQATAHITQTLFNISIKVDAKNSESETLNVQAKKEPASGVLKLYYIFQVTPWKTDNGANIPYKGAAILTLPSGTLDNIRGNYFTDRSTTGHYSFKRDST